MIQILGDFKPILHLDLYGEHMPEEGITGSKIDLNLSAGSTYKRVYSMKIHHPFLTDWFYDLSTGHTWDI